ncbi:Hypothetical predicted protein [Octopus vulgaris]|uniref:Uncharacterized protein n=1 Tax=Octopus vulgaris TaxID=6645 RepID=A0AA36B0W2_OCTVU|nr:Hypothetical predicted protein [Octopus vulgaris]
MKWLSHVLKKDEHDWVKKIEKDDGEENKAKSILNQMQQQLIDMLNMIWLSHLHWIAFLTNNSIYESFNSFRPYPNDIHADDHNLILEYF